MSQTPSPAPQYVAVTKVGSIADGCGETFTVGERLVAVFRRGDGYYAIDDHCPHMGASLGAGRLDEDGAVACPWHAWRFSALDGTWCDNPRIKTDSFDVRIEGDDVLVCVQPRPRESKSPR
jgi:nitrite reductase (NADH) small subunit/3-phenylpropionate/trans-cinnamate dioxygenase ferredoxin subunit